MSEFDLTCCTVPLNSAKPKESGHRGIPSWYRTENVFVLTDGEDYMLLPEAKDYKRVGVGDTGLNTGVWAPLVPPLADFFIQTTVESHQTHHCRTEKDQLDYKGFIFFGLMNDNMATPKSSNTTAAWAIRDQRCSRLGKERPGGTFAGYIG